MANEYTIYFPNELNFYSARYRRIKTADIETFNFSTFPHIKCRDYNIDGGL